LPIVPEGLRPAAFRLAGWLEAGQNYRPEADFTNIETLKYPIGRFEYDAAKAAGLRLSCIAQIAALPAEIAAAVRGLNDAQLDTPYRDGGWTARQVVHHVADSHMNAFGRVKLALTEDKPTVKPYDENLWAALPDTSSAPIEPSLELLRGLHARWIILWNALREDDFAREFAHPEYGTRGMDWVLAQYAWHGRQHTAHIIGLRKRMGW
jgi:hypothetical protein